MVIRVKGAAPADQTGLLPLPVHLGGNVNRTVNPHLAQLLCGGLRNVNAVLFAGHHTDGKADFLAVSQIISVFAHFTARRLQNGFCLFGVIIIPLGIGIIINIALKRPVGAHPLSQQNRVHNCLSVDCVADGGDDIAIFVPVVVLEVKEDTAIVACFHVIGGKTVFFPKQLCVFGVKQRQIKLARGKLHGLRIVIGDNLKHNAVNVGRAFKILFVFYQRD